MSDTYTITVDQPVGDVTGFRLDILTHTIADGQGPLVGYWIVGGNAILTEITVDGEGIPEPATLGLLLAGGGLTALRSKRSR